MPASSLRTHTSMPASRTCSTAPMWSQWPWVSRTEVTPRRVATRSSRSCSLAASSNVASPVRLQRTTYTLFSIGPTTKRCTSARPSDQTISTLSTSQLATQEPVCHVEYCRRGRDYRSVGHEEDCDELWIQRGARRTPQDGQAIP